MACSECGVKSLESAGARADERLGARRGGRLLKSAVHAAAAEGEAGTVLPPPQSTGAGGVPKPALFSKFAFESVEALGVSLEATAETHRSGAVEASLNAQAGLVSGATKLSDGLTSGATKLSDGLTSGAKELRNGMLGSALILALVLLLNNKGNR